MGVCGMAVYQPDTANEVQCAEAGGEVLEQVPGTMQRLHGRSDLRFEFYQAVHTHWFVA